MLYAALPRQFPECPRPPLLARKTLPAACVLALSRPTGKHKVDIVNGEGKTLADKDGKIVEATGVDANRLFTIKTITVVD